MTREEAYQILTQLIKNPNLIKHHLAAEAAMRGIGQFLKAKKDPTINIDDWGLVGLLHDADYEQSKNKPEEHTLILERQVGNQVKPEIMQAIKSHAYNYNGVSPQNLMDWAIYTCDELTGFIIACALIHPAPSEEQGGPEKKLSALTVDFILNRMKEPSFAKAVDRNQINMCEEKLGIPLEEFIAITLLAMQSISKELFTS